MAGEDRMTPENQADGRVAAGSSTEAKSDTPFGQWIVFRGRLGQRLEFGEIPRRAKLADYFEATRFVDQETLPPIQSRVEIPHETKTIILELDSNHPKTNSKKDVPVTEWLEELAKVSAKLDLISHTETVPYDIRKQAEQRNRLFTASASQAIDIVRKEGRENLTREDRKRIFPEGVTRGKVVRGTAAVVATLALAACGIKVLGPGVGVAPTEAQSPTPSQVWTPETPTPGSSATPEVSPTPEVVACNPVDIDSWPERARDFFLNHPENAGEDAWFQQCLDLGRRQYLSSVGVAGVEAMSSRELMNSMIRQSAIEQRTVILAPAEIISMITDHGDWMRPHVDPANKAWYDLFEGVGIIRDITVAPTPTIDENAFEEYMKFSHISKIFGRNTEVPVFPAYSVRLDHAGVIELPGGSERRGILMRYLDPSGGAHYRVYRVLNEPTTFGSGDSCIVGEKVNCPYPLEGGGIKIRAWTPETNFGNIDTTPRHPAEDLLPFLMWPPHNSSLVMLSNIHFADPAVFAVIDPQTGLLVADYIEIWSQEEFPTKP